MNEGDLINKRHCTILECTLRDGSYLIDYQFTAEDTYIICLGLYKAGFKYIEIGHGTGLRSSLLGQGIAAATDEQYLQAARNALDGTDAMYGMFFIPGIGEMEDLIMASEHGMNFVRIGTNVTEVDQAKPYIEKAKSLNMTVASNLMKSYAVDIEEFIRLAQKADDFGVDIITVVDSAGGMTPNDVREYVSRLRDVTGKEIGFHGHNNLHLAIANTLEAVKAGATIVDSSIQGMGRSAGNAQTEILVMLLQKMGYETGVDPYLTMDIGNNIVKPMMNRIQGVDDISIISGIAQFHSSFSRVVNDAAEKYEVDPRLLIMQVSEKDRVLVTKELAEETAREIKKSDVDRRGFVSFKIDTNFLFELDNFSTGNTLENISDEMVSLSKKTGLESVFSITISPHNITTYPYIRKSASMVIGNCEAANVQEASSIIDYLDGKVDWILLDRSCKEIITGDLQNKITKSGFALYSEERVLRMSTLALLSQYRLQGRILVFAGEKTVMLISLALESMGLHTVSLNEIQTVSENIDVFENILKDVDIVVSFDKTFCSFLREEHAQLLGDGITVFTARPNAFPEPFWNQVMERGLNLYRVDSRVGFASELHLVVETKKMMQTMGVTAIGDIPVVSGGKIGSWGTVVVDSVIHPTKVIGIADGNGGLLKDVSKHREKIEKIRASLIENIYY